MADFIFRISPNVVLGSYVVTRVPQYVKEYGSRFMVVMDPVLKDVGLADKILQPLNERNVDYFIFDEATQTLTGEKSKLRYRLGDRVLIRVKAASRDEKTIDFEIIKKI